jgi:hypothetical protein
LPDAAGLRGPALWVWTVLLVLLSWLSAGSAGVSGMFGSDTTMWLMMMDRGGRFMGGGMSEGAMSAVIMLALPIAACVGMLAILGSWIFLYMYFMTHVLPLVLPAVAGAAAKGKSGARGRDPRASGWQQERQSRRGAGYLRRAYQLLIVGAAAKAAPTAIMAVLPWLGRF